ncbi:MAG: nuclease-related domain-containing protein [Candidatus Thermoplasmatota archaeon]
MTLEFYNEDIGLTPNERKQLRRIKAKLTESLGDAQERYCLIVDLIIGPIQYDLVMVKGNAIASIELKGYRGNVRGRENGRWKVEGPDGAIVELNQDKNPFAQARDQRYRLMGYLNERLPRLSKRFDGTPIRNLSAIVCFEEGSVFDPSQIEHRLYPWFEVTDEGNLVDALRAVSSREFALRDSEIDALLEELGVLQLDQEDVNQSLVDDSPQLWKPPADDTVITLDEDEDRDGATGDGRSDIGISNLDHLTSRHIESALATIDRTAWPSKHDSKTWDLVAQGKRYPPKYVLFISNQIAGGPPIKFTAHKANRHLTRLGYTIVRKHTGEPWARR